MQGRKEDKFIVPEARESVMAITPYVPGKPIDEVNRELGVTDVVKLASNENPLGPSKVAVEAIVSGSEEVYLYPDGGCYVLRSLLSSELGVGPDSLIFGAGSDEVIRFIAETFVNPGDEVVYGSVSFSQYEFVTRIVGGTCVPAPMEGLDYDIDAIISAVNEKTRAIFLANPNNPTGGMVTKDQVDRIISAIPEDVLLILDEAYYEYVDNDGYPDSVADYVKAGRNVIVLRTFSKIHALAGLRIGYGVARPEIISLLNKVKPPFNVTSVAQAAAAAALTDREHVAESVRVNKEGREYLYQEFDKMGLDYVRSEANFVLVDVGKSSKSVFSDLLKRGIIVRTGDIFGIDTHIRVTVGTREQNKRFIRALAAVIEG